MTVLIELREKIKGFFSKYDVYIIPVLKFALAMAVFIGINNMLGYLEILDNLFVVAVLALICAVCSAYVITPLEQFLISAFSAVKLNIYFKYCLLFDVRSK